MMFARQPDWRLFARVENGYLVVEIPSPIVGGPGVALYTEDDEIVGFDRWHEHFDCWFDIAHEQAFNDAPECMHGLLAERLAVAVRMRGK